MTDWLPPHPRPNNECAGYLGYYTRSYLPVKFDLIDLDGLWPAVWINWKARNGTLRVFEEKLAGAELHPSQRRCYGVLAELIELGLEHGQLQAKSGVYVIHDAERLASLAFPIRLDRLSKTGTVAQSRLFERDDFDQWLLQEGDA